MADRPGEHQADSSREVVAEAAASLKDDPTYRQAADEFAGKESSEPAEDASPEPQDEGSPTEPAAQPDALEGDEEVRDDFDPESEAVYPDEDAEDEPEPVAAEPPKSEPEPTTTPETAKPEWTDEDQKDYEAFRAFRASQEKEREAEAARESEQAIPQGDPSQEDLKGVIQELMTKDYRIQQAVAGLDAHRKSIQANRTRLGELRTEAEKVAGDVAAHEAKLIAHEELANDPEMDADYMRPKIQKAQQALFKLQSHQNRLLLEAERLERVTDRLDMEYQNGMHAVNQAGRDEWDSRVRQARERNEYDRDFQKANEEWKESLPRVVKAWGVDPGLSEDVSRELRELVTRAGDDEIAEGRLEGWMLSQKKPVLERFERIRQAALSKYVQAKEADVAQPAPPPERSTASPRANVPLSSKDADRLAAKSLVQRLRSVAR